MDSKDSENPKENSTQEIPVNNSKVTFDDLLKELGQFGTYQRKIYLLLFLVN